MAKVKPDKKVGSRASRDRDDGAEARDARDARPHGTPVGSRAPRDRIAKVRLGDVCEVAAGQGAPQGDAMYSDEGTPFIKAGDLSRLLAGCKECEVQKVPESTVRKYKLKLQPAGSLLFAKSGMSCMKGYVYRLRSDCYVVSHLAIIKPSEKVCSGYLEHCFRFNRPNGLVKDPAYPSISLADISDFSIPLPPLPTQRRIADELDRLCALKKNAEDRLAILDQIVKSRFVEMFGEEKRYELVCVGDVFKVGGPKRIHKEEWTKEGIPFLKISDLVCRMEDEVNAADCYISESRYAELKAEGQVPIPGDVLVTARGTLGRCYVVGADDKFYFQDGMISWLSNKDESIDLTYFLSAVQMPEFKRQYEGKSSGTTVAYLTIGQLAKLQLPLPPIGEQRKFAAFVAEVDKAKAALRETVATLDQLYRAKLQEYFG